MEAVLALKQIRTPQAIAGLLSVIADESVDGNTRRTAIEALEINDQRAIEGLLAALQDKDVRVRRTAAVTLGKIGGPQIVEAMLIGLQDERVQIRRVAVETLRQAKDPTATAGLLVVLTDEDERVRGMAVEALEKIVQDAEPISFCSAILKVCLNPSFQDAYKIFLYELLVKIGPRLHKAIQDIREDDDLWLFWRRCLTWPTHYVSIMGHKEQN